VVVGAGGASVVVGAGGASVVVGVGVVVVVERVVVTGAGEVVVVPGVVGPGVDVVGVPVGTGGRPVAAPLVVLGDSGGSVGSPPGGRDSTRGPVVVTPGPAPATTRPPGPVSGVLGAVPGAARLSPGAGGSVITVAAGSTGTAGRASASEATRTEVVVPVDESVPVTGVAPMAAGPPCEGTGRVVATETVISEVGWVNAAGIDSATPLRVTMPPPTIAAMANVTSAPAVARWWVPRNVSSPVPPRVGGSGAGSAMTSRPQLGHDPARVAARPSS
jgi:hypothetical protein